MPCRAYPSDLKSLEECCDVPVLFTDTGFGTCEYFCQNDKSSKDSPDCPLLCLFKNNNIFTGQLINKTAMEAFFDKHGAGDPHWRPIIKQALEKCDLVYDQTKSFKEAFEKFEDCVNIHFEENCVSFKEPVECDKVEDFMMKCQNVQHNCTVWPKWIVKIPEVCCNDRPQLFNSSLVDKASDFCSHEDIISNTGAMQCLAAFLLNSTNVRTAGKWNFEIATKMLKENSINDPKWKVPIEKSIEICEKQVHGTINLIKFLFKFESFLQKTKRQVEKFRTSTFGSTNASRGHWLTIAPYT